jgi:hypothetical protein
MSKPRKLVNKKSKKKFEGKCCFCGEADYALLDLHRIVEGKNKGIYSDFNTIVSCSNCHRRVHDKQIVIDRKYYSTAGKWVLHYWINGEERWE